MRNRKHVRAPILTLDEQLSAIGLMISVRSLTSKEIESVDIEESLATAFVSLNDPEDQRLLSRLLSWVSIHGSSRREQALNVGRSSLTSRQKTW